MKPTPTTRRRATGLLLLASATAMLATACAPGVSTPAPSTTTTPPTTTTPTPTTTPAGELPLQASPISSNANRSCAVTSDRAVECWGNLAAPGTRYRLPGITDAVSVTIGVGHMCVITTARTVQCIGMNNYGQVGNGTTVAAPTAVDVVGISNAVSITAGGAHTCALLSDKSLKCWGLEQYWLDGSPQDYSTTPVEIDLPDVVSVDSSGSHTCAVTSTGSVWCWGSNIRGQLGDGTVAPSAVPVQVRNLTGATSVSAGYSHSCAVLTGGFLRCWGYNDKGQLGDGTIKDPIADINDHLPVTALIGEVVSVDAGSESHTCAVRTNKTVSCWGDAKYGQVGDGAAVAEPEASPGITRNQRTPLLVPGISDVTQVSLGRFSTCAVTEAPAVACWGRNDYGQLGRADTQPSGSPIVVPGLP